MTVLYAIFETIFADAFDGWETEGTYSRLERLVTRSADSNGKWGESTYTLYYMGKAVANVYVAGKWSDEIQNVEVYDKAAAIMAIAELVSASRGEP